MTKSQRTIAGISVGVGVVIIAVLAFMFREQLFTQAATPQAPIASTPGLDSLGIPTEVAGGEIALSPQKTATQTTDTPLTGTIDAKEGLITETPKLQLGALPTAIIPPSEKGPEPTGTVIEEKLQPKTPTFDPQGTLTPDKKAETTTPDPKEGEPGTAIKAGDPVNGQQNVTPEKPADKTTTTTTAKKETTASTPTPTPKADAGKAIAKTGSEDTLAILLVAIVLGASSFFFLRRRQKKA